MYLIKKIRKNITKRKRFSGTSTCLFTQPFNDLTCLFTAALKVAFAQNGLMCFSFLETDEPNYFPGLEF